MPLGSGALAGNPFSINRSLLAKDLGFLKCSYNSMHAVGSRDFVGKIYKYKKVRLQKKKSNGEKASKW